MPVYVTGGGGTHLEPRVTSHYLAALIAEAGARGVLGTVTAVKTQQEEIDAPLDDLVIEGCLPNGTATRLDLQITTSLSFTESDEKWKDIVGRAWNTFRRLGFNGATDRIGIAVSHTTTKLERSIQPLLARARHAADAGQYRKRLAARGGSNNDQREFQRVLDGLIKAYEATATDDEIVSFMKSLTIVAFDLDQEEASRDRLASIDQLAPIVGGNAEGKQVWSSLTAMAGRIIPSGGGVNRAAVALALETEGHRIGADRTHAELVAALDAESRLSADGIRDTIGGQRIERDALHERLLDALTQARLVRIVGQHGAGKSAILKRLALEQPAGAPILLLRDLRVTGGGWPAHAAKFGRVAPLATVLREFGLGGSRTLFIDGADRMDAAVQVTVNDLLKTITKTPDLDSWQVVITMREENAQRVDGWLDADANGALTSRTVRVEGFDHDEAQQAADALPLLRPLLADTRNYDTVLRRPFFLDALSRLPVAAGTEVRSEVDLVELWWEHGGADRVDFAPAQGRRNLLLSLGERLMAEPGAPLPIRDMDPAALDELLKAGVLRHAEFGISTAFSHDIYEEWVLERILRQRRGDIAQAIRDGREDLQLARPLQLLAAFLLERAETGDDWSTMLAHVGAEDLRATWVRVVLAAPVRSVHSGAMLDKIEPILMRDDGSLLARLIFSVRTAETLRDLRFLDEELIPDLRPDQREQYASEAAVPDIVTWFRLLNWLIPRLNDMPPGLAEELQALLEAWVDALPAEIGEYAHVPAIAAWARARVGDTDSSKEEDRTRLRWSGDEAMVKARALLLKCAPNAKDIVRDYLATMSDAAVRNVRKQISEAGLILAGALPAQTAAFIERAYLLDHDRQRTFHSTMRELGESLGFDDGQDFYPASPARPPFLHLLRANPAVGLELIRKLCNHAMEGWRRSWQSGETPIPIAIDLGEDLWEFWGDDGTYGWFRGGSHVHMLDTALLALDGWAQERLAAGDELDELCRLIARGNQLNAVLGICAGLCLASLNAAATSPVALAIATHPALWQWDLSRQLGDQRSHSNEIAYWGGSQYFAAPLQQHNRLPHRQRTVRDLSVLFAALAPEEVRQGYAAAIATFLDRVPYATAEERDDPRQAEALRNSFEIFRQQADPGNLVVEEKDGKTYFSIIPSYATSEPHKAMLAGQEALGRVLRLHLWATKAVEEGKPGADMALDGAFDEMIALDEAHLFDEMTPVTDMERHYAQSAVSGSAAVLARHADAALWERAEAAVIDIVRRAATMTEVEDQLSYRGAHITGHPPAMAAQAYAALLRREPTNMEWRGALLQLAVDPIEAVRESVYQGAELFAEVAPDMVWRLFCLATQRAARTHHSEHGLAWSPAEAREQSALAEEAERFMAEGVLPVAHPAPATAGARSRRGVYHWDFHAHALLLPVEPMLGPETRAEFIEHVASALDWALLSLAEKDGRGGTPFEWLHKFGRWLGTVVALISAGEMRALLLARADPAEPRAAGEIMDMVMQHFMIHRMLRSEPLDSDTLEKWEELVDWAVARPGWSRTPSDAQQHDRGMAVSALFCGIARGMVCGIERDWPNLAAVLPSIERAAGAFATERTAFNAVLALLRARPELLPGPGLDWIKRAISVRKAERDFWMHGSNGERLAVVLQEFIAAGPLQPDQRDTVVKTADALIELGVKGAAFLQQDLVRPRQ